MTFVNIVNDKGVIMDQDKVQEFAKLTASISSSMAGLLDAQKLLVKLMCKEGGFPLEMQETMINDMNKVIGIKKL